jgi:hypothetical protein
MLEDDQIFKEATEFGKIFHQKCGKSLRFDSTKQNMDALFVRLVLFCVLDLTKPVLGRRLVAADSSRIACHLLEVLCNESAEFTGLPRRCFGPMPVAVQLTSRFTRTKICRFEANDNQDVMMMTMDVLRDESKRNSEKSHGLRLANKQAGIFCLRRAIFYCLYVGQVEACWTQLKRLIQRRIIGFIRRNSFHEIGPITTGMPAVLPAIMRSGTVITGSRLLIEFSWRLNCSQGKQRWDERSVFSACERCPSHRNWRSTTLGLLRRLQKQIIGIAPEADDNPFCYVSATATIPAIVWHSLIVWVRLVVTFCRPVLLAAQLLMNR